MIALLGHRPNALIHFLGIFVLFIGFEQADLAGELGLDDGHRHLPPVGDVESGDRGPNASILQAATELTLGPDLPILLPEEGLQ